MTDGNWKINTPAPESLGWDNYKARAPQDFPEFPRGIQPIIRSGN